MELYSIYEAIFMLGYKLKGKSYFTVQSLLGSFFIALAVIVVFFIVQGVGIYKMAKKRELKNAWLAFVPFASTLYLGKLAGKCSFFGHKMKGAAVYAMVAQIVAFVGCGLIMLAEGYLFTQCGEINVDPSTGMLLPPELTGSEVTIYNAYDVGGYVLSVVNLVYQILLFIVVMALYKSYSVKNYMPLSFLQLFVPMSRYIVVCVLRNNKAVDYDEYMRQKREEYIRRHQQYNPYGHTPYGPYSQHNPYANQPPYNDPSKGEGKKPEEPFEEFSSDKKPDQTSGGDDPFFS